MEFNLKFISFSGRIREKLKFNLPLITPKELTNFKLNTIPGNSVYTNYSIWWNQKQELLFFWLLVIEKFFAHKYTVHKYIIYIISQQ